MVREPLQVTWVSMVWHLAFLSQDLQPQFMPLMTTARCSRIWECDRSDRLVFTTYNAAAHAARSGNALAVLLAAIRKTSCAEDQDTRDMMDAALSAHAQLTRDIGAAMASAILTRRQTASPDQSPRRYQKITHKHANRNWEFFMVSLRVSWRGLSAHFELGRM